MRRTVPSTLAIFFALAAGCGGAPESELLTGPNAGGSSGGDASVDGGSHGSGDGGQPQDSSGPIDAGGDADVAADSSDDGGGNQPSVLCPMNGQAATCSPGQLCCVSGDPMGMQSDICMSASTGVCQGTPVSCAATSDCLQGQVCCGTEVGAGMTVRYQQVTCQQDCSGMADVEFCNPMANDCPSGTPNCVASMLLDGFSVCHK